METSRCSICQFSIRSGRNVFEESIGEPPVRISEVLITCTGISTLTSESIICRKCCDKLSRFYKSLHTARRLKQEFLDLIAKNRCNKDDEEEKEEDTVDFAESEYTDIEELEQEKEQQISFEEEQEEYIEEVVIEQVDDNNFDYEEEKYYIKDELIQVADVDDFKKELVDTSFDEYADAVLTQLEAIDDKEEKNFEEKCKEESDSEEIDRLIPTKKNLQIKCSECNEYFKSEKKLEVHIRKLHFKGYICEQCGKTLYSKTGFLRHLENHDPENKFHCDVCGQSFKNKLSLNHHMAWHSGEKPYQCDICQKRFVHRVAVYKHKMIHDNDSRRVECAECGFKFRTKAHLNRHMTTHTGIKPHSCPICGKCFSLAYNLTVHVQEHEQPGSTRQRRLKCKKCTRTFINKKNYREHCERDDCDSNEK